MRTYTKTFPSVALAVGFCEGVRFAGNHYIKTDDKPVKITEHEWAVKIYDDEDEDEVVNNIKENEQPIIDAQVVGESEENTLQKFISSHDLTPIPFPTADKEDEIIYDKDDIVVIQTIIKEEKPSYVPSQTHITELELEGIIDGLKKVEVRERVQIPPLLAHPGKIKATLRDGSLKRIKHVGNKKQQYTDGVKRNGQLIPFKKRMMLIDGEQGMSCGMCINCMAGISCAYNKDGIKI
jgi:hypothetical protein